MVWRVIFWMNLPLGIAALIVTSAVLHLPVHRREHSIDYIGAALLVAGVTCLLLVASWGGVWADTSDVKGAAPVIVGKSGKHCKDDPHCFNRYHFAIKPAAHVNPEQLFVLETRDALDSDLTFDSTAQDVAAANLNLVHPLTGPVYVNGAQPGDLLEIEYLDIVPQPWGYTRFGPIGGFLRDLFPDPFMAQWDIKDGWATSPKLPGVRIPDGCFMGTAGVAPSHEQRCSVPTRSRPC